MNDISNQAYANTQYQPSYFFDFQLLQNFCYSVAVADTSTIDNHRQVESEKKGNTLTTIFCSFSILDTELRINQRLLKYKIQLPGSIGE